MSRPSLYTRHTKIADAIAREYFLPGADMDDVHQEARLSLWIATGTYRPELGPFPPYARLAIHADLSDKLQTANRLKHRVLNDSVRDEQLQLLPSVTTEETVIIRENLRAAIAQRPALVAQEKQRARWREKKRRQKGATP